MASSIAHRQLELDLAVGGVEQPGTGGVVGIKVRSAVEHALGDHDARVGEWRDALSWQDVACIINIGGVVALNSHSLLQHAPAQIGYFRLLILRRCHAAADV
jgi:hypothetical protein